MRNSYHGRVDRLVVQLAELSEMVGDAMRSATIAALDTDLAVAQQVIDNDGLIDRARLRCEEDARVLLALQAPVATDLRTVLTPIRAAQRLERMGDLAAHIAKLVRRRHPRPVIPTVLTPRFEQMGRIAVDLADAVSTVLRHGDIELARTLRERDDEMDDLHRTLFTVLRVADWEHGVATAVDVSLLSHFYERFADHALFVADQVVFAVTGELPVTDELAIRTFPDPATIADAAR